MLSSETFPKRFSAGYASRFISFHCRREKPTLAWEKFSRFQRDDHEGESDLREPVIRKKDVLIPEDRYFKSANVCISQLLWVARGIFILI